MKKKFSIKMITISLIICIGLVILVLCILKVQKDLMLKKELESCKELTSVNTIPIPDKNEKGIGFTCTGLSYSYEQNLFIVGNAGKIKPSEDSFNATVEFIDSDFLEVVKTIDCGALYPDMRDIQGVAISSDGSLWICSCGEGIVRNIDTDGNQISEIAVKAPSGIAYDSRNDSLWVLTKSELIHFDISGNEIERYDVKVTGQDQLYLDESENVIYFTAGEDYHGDSYVYQIDLSSGQYKPLYILKDSYAIEGIYIQDGLMYILNDGYYHDAEIPYNQVNIYELP